MIFQLLSVKVNVNVFTQSLRLFPITICRLPLFFITSLDSISLPNIVHEALSHPGWRSAMLEEMQALDDNGIWDFVHLPTGKKVIGCLWVFAVKFNPYGFVARSKACLVAKGYAQTYEVDYVDTFSLVEKLTSVHLFITLATSYDWNLH